MISNAGRLSRVDAILAVGLATVTLAICLYFAPRGFDSGFVDMGHDGYQLRQVLDLSRGGVIFRDTFDQYGPLNGYLNTVGFIALGRRLLAVKYFICAWYSLIVVLLFVMARQWLSPALAAFSMLVWLGLAPFYNHGIMISPHVYALFLQALATILVLRSPGLEPRRFALVGLLAGLSWSMKQSMGALFLLAILTWMLVRWLPERGAWRRVAGAAAAMSLTFFGVIVLCLALLWRRGALGDWYLQTIAFPREFYLLTAQAGSASLFSVVTHVIELVAAFVQLQLTQPLYWIVIRAVVLLTAAAYIRRRRCDDDLLLMASITAFLWLGAYPSGNFMHQWWTAGLTIAPFVVCVRERITGWVTASSAASWMTVAVVVMVVAPGVVDRANAGVSTARVLTEALGEPPMFRGIRTDIQTKRAFETLYGIMERYRAEHHGTNVVSIESADGWARKVESLPFLSFFADNAHAHPVYWSLPVLSTSVYPRYAETFWRQVSEQRPLIVDHRYGKDEPFRICGYRQIASAPSDYGHWYLYASDDADPEREERSSNRALDGSTEHGCSEDDTERFAMNTIVDGAWRGRVSPPFQDGPIQLPGPPPLELVDATLHQAGAPVNVYTWPADLPIAKVDGTIEPVSTDVVWRSPGDSVRDFQRGAWIVEGKVPGPSWYILQWDADLRARGTRFAVRGELFEGGLQVGFLYHGRWSGFVNVTRPGLFEAVLEIQRSGPYALVVANNLQSAWLEQTRLHPMKAMLGLLNDGFLTNHFRVSQAGWIALSGPSALANANDIPRVTQDRVGGLK